MIQVSGTWGRKAPVRVWEANVTTKLRTSKHSRLGTMPRHFQISWMFPRSPEYYYRWTSPQPSCTRHTTRQCRSQCHGCCLHQGTMASRVKPQ
jgi:hypothetical protein